MNKKNINVYSRKNIAFLLLAAIFSAFVFTTSCKKGPGTEPNLIDIFDSSSTSSSASSSTSSISVTTNLGANMIINGDFPTGTTSWSLWTAAGKTVNMNAAGGELVLNNFTGDGVVDHYTIVNDGYGLNLVQGNTYVISFRARADAARTLSISPREGGLDYTWYIDPLSVVNLTASMTEYSIVYTHTTVSDSYGQLMFFLGGNNTPIYIDDIKMQQIASVITNSNSSSTSTSTSSGSSSSVSSGSCVLDTAHITKNPQTPAAAFTPVITYQNDFSAAQNTGSAQMVVYQAYTDTPSLTARGNGSVVSGAMVVNITVAAPSPGDAWHVALSQYMGGLPFVKGDEYEFTIDLKTSGASKYVTIVVQENGVDANADGNLYGPVLGKDFNPTGTMTTYTCKWRPAFSAANTRLLIWCAADTTQLTIDNIKITRLGPNPTPGTITTLEDVPYFNAACANFQLGAGTATAYNSTEDGTAEHITQYNWNSPSAGMVAGIDVVLPPSYASQPTKRYPVIYYLHGHGGTEAEIKWNGVSTTVYNGMVNATIPEVIFISVGGPAAGWWTDGDNGVKDESHIVYELLSLVDQQFRTISNQQGRAIMGFSMGGWGASKLTVKYPKFFTACMTWCGALYTAGLPGSSINGAWWDGITSPGSTGFAADYTALWSDNADEYAYDCARAMLPVQKTALISEGVKFFVHENTGDVYLSASYRYDDQFIPHSRAFRDELTAAGVTVTYSESLCPNPFYTGLGTAGYALSQDPAPHSPKNITALDIKKLLDVMQTTP